MLHFSKTELGLKVLKDRSIPLNARQRQLLLLIDTPDLAKLSNETKIRIAQPEILDFLYKKGLIFDKQSNTYQSEKLNTKLTNPITIKNNQHLDQNKTQDTVNKVHEETLNYELDSILSFNEVKELMQRSLKQYCGLLAKPTINQIEHALNFDTLQRCRIQWITHLQESKIHPNELNFYLQRINYSLVKINNK